MAEDTGVEQALGNHKAMAQAQFSELQLTEGEADEQFSRVSKLAVAVLPLAVIGILAVVTPVLRPYCWGVAIVAFVAYMRVAKSSMLSGTTPAVIGLGIALLGGFWSLTSQFQTNRYLFEVAGQHAETYLSLLSAGKAYEAMELRKPEVDRQITGTSLKLLYAGGESELKDEMNAFLEAPATKFVMESGSTADWVAAEGIKVIERDNLAQILVKMTNSADGGSRPVLVTLERNATGIVDDNSKALWHVVDHFFEGGK